MAGEKPTTEPEKKETPGKEDEKREEAPAAPKEPGVLINAGEETQAQPSESKEGEEGPFDLKKELADLRSMDNGQLMQRLFERLQSLIQKLSGGGLEKLFGLGGASFSPKQVEEITVDIEKAEKEEYKPESKNKAVEFVCKALNLPVKNNVTALLYSLRNTANVVYEQDKNMLTEDNAHVGDVLFFRKEDESQPYLTAVLSDKGPPMMMKYMNEEGEVKIEEILKSPLYEKEWFGFIKIPEKKKNTEESAPAAEAPAAEEPGKEESGEPTEESAPKKSQT